MPLRKLLDRSAPRLTKDSAANELPYRRHLAAEQRCKSRGGKMPPILKLDAYLPTSPEFQELGIIQFNIDEVITSSVFAARSRK